MLLVKKYPNRRLYDTRNSRYITLDDLEKMVRAGEDVVVQDAQDGRDLTQETLTQIILDRGSGRILPAALLLRLIRLDDAALGEFLTRYVSWALEIYLQARGGAQALLPLNPLATAPFAATDAIARLMLGATQWARPRAPAPPMEPLGIPGPPPSGISLPADDLPPMPIPVPVPASSHAVVAETPAMSKSSDLGDEMLRLRREIEALKESLGAGNALVGRGRNTPKKRAKRAAKR
jgi:polyhydroxyalkanoate synthesis repressor PhaR